MVSSIENVVVFGGISIATADIQSVVFVFQSEKLHINTVHDVTVSVEGSDAVAFGELLEIIDTYHDTYGTENYAGINFKDNSGRSYRGDVMVVNDFKLFDFNRDIEKA